MCASSGNEWADNSLFVYQDLPLSTLPSSQSTFFLFPSNTHVFFSPFHFTSSLDRTAGEKMRVCSLPNLPHLKCFTSGRLFLAVFSHPSFTFTFALMQLYLRLPSVSFSLEWLNAHKAVTSGWHREKCDVKDNVSGWWGRLVQSCYGRTWIVGYHLQFSVESNPPTLSLFLTFLLSPLKLFVEI